MGEQARVSQTFAPAMCVNDIEPMAVVEHAG
jgi:hypothetical protein